MNPEQHMQISLETHQGTLLKLAKMQRKLQQAQSLLSQERSRANEIQERWEMVCRAVGAKSDDTVKETADLIVGMSEDAKRLEKLVNHQKLIQPFIDDVVRAWNADPTNSVAYDIGDVGVEHINQILAYKAALAAGDKT